MRKKTDLVTWSPRFSVGIKLIDDQHKGLLNLVNNMFNHIPGNEADERKYFRRVIKQATEYVKVHFSTEEKLMIRTKFPGYAAHKRSHDTFITAVVHNVWEYDMGRRFALVEFTRFLREWILTHIAVMDKQFFSYFLQPAVRKAGGELGDEGSGEGVGSWVVGSEE
jgi:hemerythrin